MTDQTLTVMELMKRADQAMASAFPAPVWVRGEITGFRRTSRGAAFFRLADVSVDNTAVDVAARGRVMYTIDKQLEAAGLGPMRNGVEVRVQGTVGIDERQSVLRLSLLQVDPAFTAGRLAIERAEVLKRLSADGSLQANKLLEIPLVPLRIGLVTSRGSAAHADFIEHLKQSGFRFSVKTAHTVVQGESAPSAVASAIERVAREDIDVIALIRGGGSKLDLAVFDAEQVGRAISICPVPVVTGIGHELDRTVADEAAAVYQKTPTAASDWLVAAVQDFANRVSGARVHIRREAQALLERADSQLISMAATLTGVRGALAQQRDRLAYQCSAIAEAARNALANKQREMTGLAEWFSSIGVDQTLGRGFALVTAPDGQRVIRSVDEVRPGDDLLVRFADGTVPVKVDER